MNFLHKLLIGISDESVKRNFRRFGKGMYINRAMVSVKKSKGSIKLNTSFEYSNDFVELFAEKSTGTVTFSGTIITLIDISKTLGISAVFSKRMGVGKLEISETSLPANDFKLFSEKVKDNLLMLNLASDLGSVVCKQTLPNPKKSPKEDKEGNKEAPKIDFCKCVFHDAIIADDFFFDVEEPYTQAQAIHSFLVESLDVPEKYKNDLALARLHAIHKGKIVRVLTVDGKEHTKEYTLAA
ncbi:hypothetical protein HZB00_01900 [Candidatus Woesearchaeota archaeon]|nr:hypothetical protein [Candidatus Woesearchaeota archaeon]